MKNYFSVLALVALACQPANADSVSSVVVNDGTGLVTLDSTTTQAAGADDFAGSQAVLQSFTAGGVIYDFLVGADSFASGGNNSDGIVEGVLAPLGTPISEISSASVALGDLDLATGTLDPYGDGGSAEYFNFASQSITDDTVFFLFNAGTNTSNVALVNATGANISNALSIATIGGETELADFNFSRTNGGPTNREVAGNVFAVSEFTLIAGFTVDDIAGFRGAGPTFDAQDAGIAISAVPEPSSVFALLGSLGTLLVRRRRQPPEPVTGNVCTGCHFGHPRPTAKMDKTDRYGEALDPFVLHNGRKTFHCDCGDRFKWKPKHKANQKLRRLE